MGWLGFILIFIGPGVVFLLAKLLFAKWNKKAISSILEDEYRPWDLWTDMSEENKRHYMQSRINDLRIEGVFQQSNAFTQPALVSSAFTTCYMLTAEKYSYMPFWEKLGEFFFIFAGAYFISFIACIMPGIIYTTHKSGDDTDRVANVAAVTALLVYIGLALVLTC